MIRELYRIKNADDCWDTVTGEAAPCLTYNDPDEGDEVISTGGADATLEELVQLCDQNAESVNAHDYCGAHRVLGAVLYRELGRADAARILLFIARRGGLHGMNGVCSKTDSYEELGIGKNGHDWDGSFGE